MLRKAKDLEGFHLGACDGEIGRITDFCFDDQSWTVRYLVADTGRWLAGRLVLITPHAIKGIHSTPAKVVDIDLTKQQVQQSPSINADKPVSLQFEAEYYEHANWPMFRKSSPVRGPVPHHGPYGRHLPSGLPGSSNSASGDPHLRSTNEISRYGIQALDYRIGHIENFIIDDEDWVIRYLVVDTHHWWPGKRVLLPPLWISWVSWPESKVYVDLDRETIKRAPEYDPAAPVTRNYEAELYQHYNREPYWISQGAHSSHTGN